MEKSKIEWLDGGHTVNLWWGCSKVHTGCKNCYAEKVSNTYNPKGNPSLWGEDAQRKLIKSAFSDLNKYQKQAENLGIKYKIFIGSMMDIFEDSKELINPIDIYTTVTLNLRHKLFDKISRGIYNNIIFLFLTKRPENIEYCLPSLWLNKKMPENIWIGTSISNQETVINSDILRNIPKIKRFLSIEPQIGMIDNIDLTGIDWVIQGGESGSNKRPFNIEWAYKMKEICKLNNVPYFFKQIDKRQPIPENLNIKEYPEF